MSAKNKSLYDILGIDPKADEEEIRKAFRRLARSLHPDINKADDANEKFQEVQEAYEILSDVALREKYDERLSAGDRSFDKVAVEDVFQMFFGQKWKPQESINGEHIEAILEVTAEQLLRGATMKIQLNKKRTCTDCEGFGNVRSKAVCPECKGEGGHKIEKRTPFGNINTTQKCVVCSGSGRKESVPCMTCASEGVLPHKEEFEFQLDPTALFGDKMSFKYKGHAGYGGGKTGDLCITLEQSPYDKVEVMYETDLREQRVVPLQSFLDESVYKIIFPDGSEDEMQLTIENQGNNHLVFPEKGLFNKNGNRGTYNLNLTVGLPELSKKQRNLILKALEDE